VKTSPVAAEPPPNVDPGANPSWNPASYLTFGDQRLRPALDLIGRIPVIEAAAIADLGCGPGNITPHLQNRWPTARILGVDNSAEMLEKARTALPDGIWEQGDIARWQADGPLDLVFSNAALHWLEDHAGLFPRLLGLLRSGGVLAVQMPDTGRGPWREILRDLAKEAPWRAELKDLAGRGNVLPMADYQRLLSRGVQDLDIWQTGYLHVLDGEVLDGEDPVFAWTRGAGLRPFLDRLQGDRQESFCDAYRARLREAYPPEPDGRVLFPFERLFVVAVKL
jgi:trans-aconitate 2-methyltransferase